MEHFLYTLVPLVDKDKQAIGYHCRSLFMEMPDSQCTALTLVRASEGTVLFLIVYQHGSTVVERLVRGLDVSGVFLCRIEQRFQAECSISTETGQSYVSTLYQVGVSWHYIVVSLYRLIQTSAKSRHV